MQWTCAHASGCTDKSATAGLRVHPDQYTLYSRPCTAKPQVHPQYSLYIAPAYRSMSYDTDSSTTNINCSWLS